MDRSSSHSGLVARQSRYAGERARGDRGGYYPRRLCLRQESVGTGDTVELAFSMEIHQVRANPNIRGMPARPRFSAGRWYTAWSVDHGAPVSSLSLAGYPKLHSRFDADLLGGAVVIEGEGWLEESDDWGDELYRSSPKKRLPASLKAIPYYLWGNRGENEMAVWVRELPHTV